MLLQNSWTAEEREWILNYVAKEGEEDLQRILGEQFEKDSYHKGKKEKGIDSPEEMLRVIHQRAEIPEAKNISSVIKMVRWAGVAAASVLLIFGTGYFFYQKQQSVQQEESKTKTVGPQNDVYPGAERATLMLDDGSAIVLDQVGDGKLASQGNTEVIKSGSRLGYQVRSKSEKGLVYNILTTPRGGRFFMELSDGTKVWLNAASSIRFPVVFQEKQRVVEVTGEVYFEVASLMTTDAKRKVPFVVKINTPSGDGGEVEVLGTQFNIMAYSDEAAVETTLLEGSVVYRNGGGIKKLLPGEQSVFSSRDGIRVSDRVNLNEIIAWKDGYFHFDGRDLEIIMRQLSRWYNTKIIFRSKSSEKFYADIPMNTMLSDVLKALELTGKVHFEIENSTVIINP